MKPFLSSQVTDQHSFKVRNKGRQRPCFRRAVKKPKIGISIFEQSSFFLQDMSNHATHMISIVLAFFQPQRPLDVCLYYDVTQLPFPVACIFAKHRILPPLHIHQMILPYWKTETCLTIFQRHVLHSKSIFWIEDIAEKEK